MKHPEVLADIHLYACSARALWYLQTAWFTIRCCVTWSDYSLEYYFQDDSKEWTLKRVGEEIRV